MQDTLVIEQYHIALLPIMRIHQLGTDTGPLQLMHHLPNRLQIINHVAVRQVDLAHGGGMHLQGQLARDGVLPYHGEDLHLGGIDGGQVRVGEFERVGEEAEAVGTGLGGAHPNVWMRGVLNAAGSDEFLVCVGEDVVHFVSTHKGRGAERDVQFVACAVIVAQCLSSSLWHGDREEGGHFRRAEIVERGINVPAVEARVAEVVFFGDRVLVEFLVMGVHELDVGKAFVFGHEAVADDLHFGLVGNSLQIWVKDAAFGIKGLAVAVADGGGVKTVGQFVLRFG